MSATEIAFGDAQAVERWSPKLAREALSKTYFKKFAGPTEDDIIQIHKDLESMAGDVIKYDVLYQSRGDGVQGDSNLEDYEEALEMYQESLNINKLRHAHSFRGMTQQRTVHDLRKLAKLSLAGWYAWKFDTMMFAYLAGVAGDTAETANGTIGTSGFASNALEVPDAAHHVDKSGGSNTMTLDYIDTAVALAKTVNPRLRPVMVGGQAKFVCVLHTYSAHALRTATTGRTWEDIHKYVGERAEKNPIYSGALGEYNGCIIHETEYIPRAEAAGAWSGAGAGDTANLLLGAQAGAFALGNAYDKIDSSSNGGGGYFSWVEQKTDYGNKKGVGVDACFGIKKNRFNGADFGSMRITTTETTPS